MSLTITQECLSSKRKEMWKTIQTKVDSGHAVQLILDMKVRWSSTYLMLDHAERKRDVRTVFRTKHCAYCCLQCVNTFVDELRWEEQDSSKRDKIHELKLTSEEWGCVNTFLSLLSVRLLRVGHFKMPDSSLACRQCSASLFLRQYPNTSSGYPHP
jgi:hypothetical protein